ncbi:MAG: PhnD/SsuA/transferrin family substrate-binding protein [Rhizobiales bacterium]|nr:PhnD/SsuA/transferrin family substrate-binding protein [Hyphomicrobiales bacterium]
MNMTVDRRKVVLGGLATTALASVPFSAGAQELRTVRSGIGFKSVSPAVINLFTGEALGFARENGIRVESAVLGSANNCMIAIDRGAVEFAVVSSSFALPLHAKGQLPPVVMFYEYTYPYKWDIVVKPGSPIKSYQDLRGKKIGVSTLGTSDYPVTRMVMDSIGLNPDKDVSWVAVGEGITAGVALERGVIDGLAYFDSGFAVIENAGIKLDYLPRPPKVPMIGGLFLGARRDFIQKNPKLCIAYGRTVAMTSEFLLANPSAGAHAFGKMFPTSIPRNVSPAEAVRQTVVAIQRRISLYRPPYPGVKMGTIVESELREEAKFNELDIRDFSPLYTNELIDEINNFDRDRVTTMAKSYQF